MKALSQGQKRNLSLSLSKDKLRDKNRKQVFVLQNVPRDKKQGQKHDFMYLSRGTKGGTNTYPIILICLSLSRGSRGEVRRA